VGWPRAWPGTSAWTSWRCGSPSCSPLCSAASGSPCTPGCGWCCRPVRTWSRRHLVWRRRPGKASDRGVGGVASYARIAAGVALLLAALVLFAVQTGGVGVARDVVVAGVLGVIGLGLTIGPWLFRLTGDLSEERAARVRSQERADMAAHLHDSVLQTLALIQKHAGDGRTVATLARAQERDLRSWLYGDQPADTSVAGALREAAAEVEDAHGLPVELVVVGDCPLTESVRPLVLAAREAMVNAARHSGADRVDVYAECGAERVEVFVRDRGRGFDEHAVPPDRHGLQDSIHDRMRRHGGTAVVRTAPGEGTEVRLVITTGGTS
jgi:histidine kinase-like protein